jgi:serine/threonine-protein kinase
VGVRAGSTGEENIFMSQGGAEKPESGGKPSGPPARPAQPAKPGSGPQRPAAQQKPQGPGASAVRPAPPAKPAANPPKAGTPPQLQLGSYRIVERIGAGGMGTVYRAVHVDLDREVALKVLPPEMNSNPTMVARFKREAKAAAQLQHENIVQIYDVQEDKGRNYLALEFIRGKDLSDVITLKKHLPVKQSIDILKQAARALDHAYQKGIVHRDIKPSNFLITPDGKVKLCDMGLALRTDAGEEAKVTRDGTTVGTVDYMSPEQARDSRLADTRSDIYSLGCTLYQMLTGRVPFEEGSIPEKLFKHSQELPPDPLQFNPEIPSEILYILNRMLEKKQEDRYQTPKELLADLDQLDFDEAAKQEDATRKTLAIGAEEDETATEELLLQRPGGRSTMKRQQDEAKKSAEHEKKKKLMIFGGAAAAAAVLIIGFVIFLATRPGKPTEVVTGPGVDTTGRTKGPSEPPIKPPDKPLEPPIVKNGSNKPSDDTGAMKDPPGSEGSTKSENGSTAKTDTPTTSTTPETETTPPERVSAADRAKLAAELFPPWPTTPIPGQPVVVARGTQAETGEVFASLQAACRKAQSASKKINIEDTGPFFERAFSVVGATLEIRAKPDERQQAVARPIIVFDAAADKGKDYFFQAKNSDIVLEGIDFIINADDLKESIGLKGFTIFDIQGGDLFLKDCTFTILGKHQAMSLVKFHGLRKSDPSRTPEQLARLELNHCVARGEPLTVATLNNGLADVKVIDSLFVAGQSSTLFELLPPTEAAPRAERTFRLIGTTCATRGDFLNIDGSSGGDVSTRLIFADSIIACAAPGAARKLIRTKNWPDQNGAMAKATLDERSSLYTGWGENLIQSGTTGKVSAKSSEQWLTAWGLSASDSQIRGDAWPTEDLGVLALVSSSAFISDDVSAGMQSRLGTPFIGCAAKKLPAPSPILFERTFGTMAAPSLLPAEQIVPSFTCNPQKNPQLSLWRGEQSRRRGQAAGTLKPDDQLDPVLELAFNASSDGDLGKFLQGRDDLPDTTIVTISGSGTREMSPVKLSGKKSLVLWFQPTTGQPLVIKPAAGSDGAKGLIEVVDGDLLIDGAIFQWQAGGPSKFFKVDRGNLTLSACRLIGPLTGNTGFEAISFTGGTQKSKWPEKSAATPPAGAGQAAPLHLDFHPAPHQRVNVCQLIDCYVGAESRCVGFVGSQGVLRIDNSVLITPGTLATFDELDQGGAQTFEMATIINQSTLVASKSFFEVSEWIPPALPNQPFLFSSRDSLYCDPFADAGGAAGQPRVNVLLRYGGRTLQQGILHWESEYDGFSTDIDAYVLRKDASGGRQRFDHDWQSIWGRPHIRDFVVDGTRAEKIRMKATTLKLKDFERDKKLADLELQAQCEAAKKASHGGPIGADMKRIGM